MIRMWHDLWHCIVQAIMRGQEDPRVRQQPCAMCPHHATGCYLCPRDYCSGMLNDRDDPDPTRPRPSSSGQCVYLPGTGSRISLRLNMTHQSANAYYARRAMEQGYSDIRTLAMIMQDLARIDGMLSAPSQVKPAMTTYSAASRTTSCTD
jgi:hypothetical protein